MITEKAGQHGAVGRRRRLCALQRDVHTFIDSLLLFTSPPALLVIATSPLDETIVNVTLKRHIGAGVVHGTVLTAFVIIHWLKCSAFSKRHALASARVPPPTSALHVQEKTKPLGFLRLQAHGLFNTATKTSIRAEYCAESSR